MVTTAVTMRPTPPGNTLRPHYYFCLIVNGYFKGENINICWSPNGQTIAVGNKEDLVTFFDTKTWKAKAHEQFKVEV